MTSSRRRWGLLVLGLGALASSCSILRSILPGGAPPPRPFNHEAHTVRGIGCADCHDSAEKEIHAGMPSKDFCMMCHEELDKDPKKEVDKKVAWFLDPEGKPVWSAFTRQSSEIQFSHAGHSKAKVACTQCHVGMDKDTGLVPGLLQRMDACTSCHQTQAPRSNDCRSCHRSIEPTIPPANHFQMWTKLHGECSRAGRTQATANDCALCHRTDQCITCHQNRAPEDHTNFWRLRAHGIAAAIDRSRCQTCHTTDSCVRCHQSAAPISHTAGWNAPRDTHCASCHLPLGQSGSCAVCHFSTPGHALAPPKPPWHLPTMICRTCHALTLKHLDNGDNCNACHH